MTKEEEKQVIADLIFERMDRKKTAVCLKAKLEKAQSQLSEAAMHLEHDAPFERYPAYDEVVQYKDQLKSAQADIIRIESHLKEYGVVL